jgi:proto-oncogene serine/threonine-protein kinase mos
MRRLKYSIQVASALAYAHTQKVAHLDLKPANILITSTDDCKVGDFGCSQRVEFDTGIVSPTNRSILTGTFAYRAPELLRGEPPTFKADIYSYGITMWQMRSRETPFTNQNQHVVIFGVVANGLRPKDPEPSDTDPFELSYKDLYTQCWDACPLDRPSAHELVELLNIWKENV